MADDANTRPPIRLNEQPVFVNLFILIVQRRNLLSKVIDCSQVHQVLEFRKPGRAKFGTVPGK